MLTHERLLELVYYDPETGVFTHRVTRGHVISGAEAGTVSDGYLTIGIDYKIYRANRLAWFYMTKEWPKNQVDHEDNNKLNNKWKNLRDLSQFQNIANQNGPRKNNELGIAGVSRSKGKFVARIRVNGKVSRLGLFEKASDAGEAYAAAKLKRDLELGI